MSTAKKAVFKAAVVNVELKHGNTFRLYSLFKDNTGTEYDFTGATARMRVAKKSDNSDVEDFDSSGNGITFPVLGVVQVQKLSTKLWPANCILIYDLEITLVSGDVRTFLEGEVLLTKTVTEPV